MARRQYSPCFAIAKVQAAVFAVLFIVLYVLYYHDHSLGPLCVVVGLVFIGVGKQARVNILAYLRYRLSRPRDDIFLDDSEIPPIETDSSQNTGQNLRPEDIGYSLLIQLMTPEQRDDAKRTGWITAGILDGKPIQVYVKKYASPALRWDGNCWCVGLAAQLRPGGTFEYLPDVDTMIAHLLHARTNPRYLFRNANRLSSRS